MLTNEKPFIYPDVFSLLKISSPRSLHPAHSVIFLGRQWTFTNSVFERFLWCSWYCFSYCLWCRHNYIFWFLNLFVNICLATVITVYLDNKRSPITGFNNATVLYLSQDNSKMSISFSCYLSCCLPFRNTWVNPRFLVRFVLLDLSFYVYVL